MRRNPIRLPGGKLALCLSWTSQAQGCVHSGMVRTGLSLGDSDQAGRLSSSEVSCGPAGTQLYRSLASVGQIRKAEMREPGGGHLI